MNIINEGEIVINDKTRTGEVAQTNGLRLQLLREAPGKITLILSCSSMPVADFVPACKLLKDISQIQN